MLLFVCFVTTLHLSGSLGHTMWPTDDELPEDDLEPQSPCLYLHSPGTVGVLLGTTTRMHQEERNIHRQVYACIMNAYGSAWLCIFCKAPSEGRPRERMAAFTTNLWSNFRGRTQTGTSQVSEGLILPEEASDKLPSARIFFPLLLLNSDFLPSMSVIRGCIFRSCVGRK